MLSDPFENVLGVLEQSALEKRECTRLLEGNDNRDVLLLEGEAGFAPLELFGQIAVERNFSQLICFLLPLLCIGNLHRFAYPLV
jgi:hypothetical protein